VANPLVVTGTTPTPPILVLDDTGSPLTSARVSSDSSGNLLLMRNLAYNGSVWNADDVAQPGVAIILTSGNLAVYQSPVGANPRTPNLSFLIQPDGAFRERGRTTPVGEWINMPYSATDFGITGTGTWTVAAGDVAVQRYMLIGNTLFYHVYLASTTVTGAPASLFVKLPSPYVAQYPFLTPYYRYDNTLPVNTTWGNACLYCVGGSDPTRVYLYYNQNHGSVWKAISDLYISIMLTMQIA
jgi:hypothetical protein